MATTATVISANQQSAGSVKGIAIGIQAKSKGLDSEPAFRETGRACISLQDQIDQINKTLRATAIAGSSSSTTVIGDNIVTINGTPITY